MISTKAFLLSASLAVLCILSTTSAAPSTKAPTSQSRVNRKCVQNEENVSNLQTGYSCDRYINCSNGTGTEMDCPRGLVFHQAQQACVLKDTEGACKDEDDE
ncbi:hypothetical protein BGZ91_011814 [Linnemannia elongata]|nr:hypothetical protein BGZ91_011814 [Linnemannia elongata]KAG0070538.1 hypothetical protein BGZ90_012610 [Linnemannia elongata]